MRQYAPTIQGLLTKQFSQRANVAGSTMAGEIPTALKQEMPQGSTVKTKIEPIQLRQATGPREISKIRKATLKKWTVELRVMGDDKLTAAQELCDRIVVKLPSPKLCIRKAS